MRLPRAGLARSFQITNLFPRLVDRTRTCGLRSRRTTRRDFDGWNDVAAQRDACTARTARADPLPRAIRDRACRGGRAVVRRAAPARHGTRARWCAADPAARRAARRSRRSGARARGRLDQAHLVGPAGAAGRARHRPRLRARRSRHRHERGQGALRRHLQRKRASERGRARGLHRFGNGGARREAARTHRGARATRCSSTSTPSTRSTARATSSSRRRSPCTSARSSRCSAATARASRRC